MSAQNRKSGPYTLTGGETLIAYDFIVRAGSDLVVTRQRGGAIVDLTLSVDYTVTGVGAEAGGDVVLTAPGLAGDQMLVSGATIAARVADFTNARQLNPAHVNAELDNLQRQIIEIGRAAAGALTTSRFGSGTGTRELPPDAAGRYLVLDDDGNLDVAYPPTGGGGTVTLPDPLLIDDGGTGATTVADAQANLGILVPSDVRDLVRDYNLAAPEARRTELGLGALSIQDTVGADQIDDDIVTLDHLAHGTPQAVIGYDDLGRPAALQQFGQVRVTQLLRHAGGGGGKMRGFVLSDTELYVCGDGSNNQNGMAADTTVPLRVSFNVPLGGVITDVVAGAGSTFVRDAVGRVYALGNNNAGQLGVGDTTNRLVATRIEYFVSEGISIAEVFPAPDTGGSENYTFFLATNRRMYACGDNSVGQLGLAGTAARTTPVQVTPFTSLAGASLSGNDAPSTFCWTIGGTLTATGKNHSGQLGNGTLVDRSNWANVSGVGAVASVHTHGVTAGGYAVLRLADSTLLSSGRNTRGQLGDNTTTSRSAFQAITTAATVAEVALAGQSVAARLTTGTVVTWGANTSGQLGDGATADRLLPTTPAGAFQGTVSEIQGVGTDATSAFWLRTAAGALYAAGSGTAGAVGTGSTAAVNATFALVRGLSGTVAAFGPAGEPGQIGWSVRYDDGRAAVCGHNGDGELGIGTAGVHAFVLVDAHLLNRHGPKGDLTAAATAAAVDAGAAALLAIAARDAVLATNADLGAELDSVTAGRAAMPPGLGLDQGDISASGGIVGGTAPDGTALTPVGLDALYDGFAHITDVNGVQQIARVNVDGVRQLTRGPGDKTIIGWHGPDAVAFARSAVPAGEPPMGIARRSWATTVGAAPYTAPVVRIVFSYGQSLVFGQTGASQATVLNGNPPEPEKLFTFERAINPRSNYTNASIALGGLGALVPAIESMHGGPPGGTGESPQVAFGLGVLEAHDHAGPVIVFGGGLGGAAMADLLPSTTPYVNAIACIQIAHDLAEAQWPGCTVAVAALNLEHGQSDFLATPATYQGQLATLFNGFDVDIAGITGQATPCRKIVGQNRRLATGATTQFLRGADVATLDYAIDNASVLWRQTPYTLVFDDDITHMRSPSYMRRGSLAAQAYETSVREGRRLLLSIASALRTANIVDVTFTDLPTRLQIDPTIGGDGLTLGFWYADGNSLLLSDETAYVREARITGDRTVRIWLDKTPTGTAKRIAIAWADPAAVIGTPSRRSGPRTSLFTFHDHCCPFTGDPLMIRPAGQAVSIV